MVRPDDDPRGDDARPDTAAEEHGLLELLACYDDAVVEGIQAAVSPIAAESVTADFANRLQRGEAVIGLLVQAGMAGSTWPATVASAPGGPSNGPAAAAEPADGNDQAPAKKIGRFEIIRELGRGGLGMVFLAHDPVLKRNVALKLPRPEALVSDELRRRFLREAQSVARLTHPNLVPAFEAAEVGPLLYLASTYVEGPNLASWLAQRGAPPPQERAAQWIAVLADAVHYAHTQGVLHRDITPSNVILARDSNPADGDASRESEECFTPKLVDFGLAKFEGSTAGETRAGLAMGTIGYMAPEQAQGQLDEIGPATDVYALGAVLYHLLVGRPPFEGASTAIALQRMFANDLRLPRQVNPELSRDLEAICLKCLEQRAASRYPTASDLAADLRRFLAGEPTLARPLGAAQRVGLWVRRRPTIAALIAVTCLATIMILAGSMLYSWQLAAALDTSEQRRLEAVAMRSEADSQHRQATDQRDTNEQLLYASRMQLANRQLNQGDVDEATRLLAQYEEPAPTARLRGFEWYYLRGLLHGERLTLAGHHGEVYGVAFSPDGKLVLSGGEDGLIKIWDAKSGQELRSIEAHASCTNELAFSPDGRRLASVSCDTTVKLWNTANWSLEQTLSDPTSEVLTVAFSPDGKYLAGGGKDGSICVWPLGDGGPVRRIYADPELASNSAAVDPPAVDVVAFSPDGKLLAAGLGIKGVCLWEVASWQSRPTLPTPSVALAFTPDSQQVVIGDHQGLVALYDLESSALRASLAGHVGQVQHIAVSPDGRMLATAGGNGTAIVWDLNSIGNSSAALSLVGMRPSGTRILVGHKQRVQALAFSPDAATLATASFDGTVKLWNLARQDGTQPVLECQVTGQPGYAFLSPDLRRLTVVDDERKLAVRDVRTRQRIARQRIPAADALVISPDGRHVIGTKVNQSGFDVYDLADEAATPRHLGDIHVWPAQRISFSPSGRTLATMGNDGDLCVWDVASGKNRYAAPLVGPEIIGAARHLTVTSMLRFILPDDDRLLIVAQKDRQIVDLATGRRTESHGEDVGQLANIACSPVAPWVAAVQHTPVVQLIDCASGRTVHTLHLPESAQVVAYSPDGRTLVTGSNAGRFILWHIPTGQEILTLRTAGGNILSLRFSDDARSLGAVVQQPAGSDTALYLWSVDPIRHPD